MGFGDFVKNQFIDVIEYVDASLVKRLWLNIQDLVMR